MSMNELDLLLAYKCNMECDHCFVFGSPDATGDGIVDIRDLGAIARHFGEYYQ